MRYSRLSAIVFALAPLLAGQAGGAEEPATFRSETNLVTLHVSVLDKNGHLITNVPRGAFRVTENGRPQEIGLFQREDVPVSMCLVVDSSGSMRNKYAAVTAAALALVRTSNPGDEVCFINFNDEAWIEQEFTGNVAQLEAAMKKIDPRGATAMRAAIRTGLETVKSKGRHDKKVLVVITDGNDTASAENPGLDELVRQVRASEVLIYLIGLLSEESRSDARAARRALRALAEASGGRDYYPQGLAEVQTMAPQIAREIRNQYTLGYRPSNPALDGSYRRIKVEVKGVRNVDAVRARDGYYATPEPARGAARTPR